MSGTVGTSSYGTLDRMLASANALQSQYASLQEQTTTGLVSQNYAGLASVSAQVLDLTATTNQNTAYNQSITVAQGKASVMQNALSQIQTMASTLAASALSNAGSVTPTAITAMAQQASQALAQLVSVMNTTYSGDYVFSGADTANAPVPAAAGVAASGMYTQIAAAIAPLATTPTAAPATAATIAASVTAIAAGTGSPPTTIFSSYLTGGGTTAVTHPAATVQIGTSESVPLDFPANSPAITQIMSSLAVMANSTSAMAGNADFQTLMQSTASALTSAGTSLAQASGEIGLTQDAMTAATTSYASMQTVLTSQFSDLTNVDTATAITQMQAVNTQLQSSYKVLGEVNSLNLASYL